MKKRLEWKYSGPLSVSLHGQHGNFKDVGKN